MKGSFAAGLALALLLPASALAQSPFDGTWRLDPSTVHSTGGTPAAISIKDGVYQFEEHGSPTLKVKADGADHPVTGFHGYNSVAIELVNDHTVKETDKQDGKVVGTSTATVAADGKTSTVAFTDHTGPRPASGEFVVERVGEPLRGSNAVAGRWKFSHYASLNDPSDNVTLEVSGNQVSLGDEAGGDSFTATIGGKPVPFMRDGKPSGTVSAKRLAHNTLRFTYAKDGEVSHTTTLKLAGDDRSLEMIIHDPHTGATTTMVHHKA